MEQGPQTLDLRDTRHSSTLFSDKETHQIKLVIVGESAVGKTSLALRYSRDVFRQYIDSTVGAAFFTRTIRLNETRLKLHIWDTAGQERYHSIAPLYYRGANGAIVVYDITSLHSFERAKRWVNELKKSSCRDMVMVLSGNKADLACERQVEQSQGEAFAEENGMLFMETSAKTAMNVNELFLAVVKNHKIDSTKEKGLDIRKSGNRRRRCCSKS